MRKSEFQYGYEQGQADARTTAFLLTELEPDEIAELQARFQRSMPGEAIVLSRQTFQRLMNTLRVK